MEPTNNPMSAQEAVLPMSERRGSKIFVAVVVGLLLVGGSVFGIVLTANEAVNQASASAIPSGTVAIGVNGGFSPETIKVRKGQSVTWVNRDGRRGHQIKAADDAASASLTGFGTTERLSKGESYAYIFDKPGTYHYYDVFGSSENVGTVIVTE
jgi:plastocyanin